MSKKKETCAKCKKPIERGEIHIYHKTGVYHDNCFFTTEVTDGK